MAARPPAVPRHGLARVLSRAGVCSRSQAAALVQAGRVSVDGRVVRDAEYPIAHGAHSIEVDDQPIRAGERLYLMLNKPRGVVTTARDEQGRDTVYRCLEDAGLPWVAPVGRLDKASEGLLLLSNDPQWAARVTGPATGPDKTYHVHVDAIPDAGLLAALLRPLQDQGETLRAREVRLLRSGSRNSWLEVVLEEGRNRHIRRLLAAHGVAVLRLVRVAVGPLQLGELPKGAFRHLSLAEALSLAPVGGMP